MAFVPFFEPSGLTAKQAARKFYGQDRNFDGLADRFKRNIYGGLKGDIRIAVLERDLSTTIFNLDSRPLRILDAGGGQGQFSINLAQQGHHITLCDISSDMLNLAAEEVNRLGLENNVTILHESIQSITQRVNDPNDPLAPFDLVLCHAVMEWVIDPLLLLSNLSSLTIAGGYLSLTFYNQNSVMMKNILRGNISRALQQDQAGYPGSLTPTQPLAPEQVYAWFETLPFELISKSGIRCFHDYILDPVARQHSPEELLALELQHSQIEPFRSLARYIHLVGKKSLG